MDPGGSGMGKKIVKIQLYPGWKHRLVVDVQCPKNGDSSDRY